MRPFKDGETFQVEFDQEVRAKCTVLGYDTFIPESKDVMVQFTDSDGSTWKNIMNEEVLTEMRKRGCKLTQILK